MSCTLNIMAVGGVVQGKPFLVGLVPKKNINQHMYHKLSLTSYRREPGIHKDIDVLARGIRVSNDICLQNDLALTASCIGTVC